MPAKKKSTTFDAVMKKRGVNPFVFVPKKISAFFGLRGNVKVHGTMNGSPIRVTLTPDGGGRHVLYVNGPMRKATNTDVGSRVTFVLAVDPKTRTPKMLPALAAALRAHPKAKAAWDAYRPSHRHTILTYFSLLKTDEARNRNVKRLIAHLHGDARVAMWSYR